MSVRVWIVGVGMTPFGIHRDKTVNQLTQWAVGDALADAGAATEQIDAAFFGSATQGLLQGQVMIGGQIALREMGVQSIPVYNVENACATGVSAFGLAVNHVKAGAGDVVLAVGVEKMHVDDPARSMAVFDTGYDVSDPRALGKTLEELGGVLDEPDLGRRSIFMDIYAAMARSHIRQFGTTREQIAAVAAKNHAHAVDNPRAHYRKAMTVEEVLAARTLSFPLTVPMCAPVTDGAAAVLVCNDDGLRRLRAAGAVEVLAAVLGTGTDRDISTFDGHLSTRVSARAYAQAGIEPSEVDVAEVHDATAFAEVLQTEMLGLVEPGEGGPAAERGETALGGRIPVNPSGGLESKGHPIGASGLGQLFELTEQLRGTATGRQVEGARVALAENGGGFHRGEEAVTSVVILRKGTS
ncbi:thiolase family protein [Pseudonocardia sp. WMMC193]|uniref:thiolase family protein n=1 Tax=Pseudonocardia sp. WMMC193 TaxID=2911965 RepID=UPI001F3E5890|nr:thiolase family protein [Pseudonocardia sp. WMMC193]MCF7552271.1 thiolase family protein [Pseudonocardia sp. WMMC193]